MPAYIDHHTLGRVIVAPRTGTRSITARWKKGQVWVNIPSGLTRQQLLEALDSMSPRLLARKAGPLYNENSRLEFSDFSISLRRSHMPADSITVKISLPESLLNVGDKLDFYSEKVQREISRGVEFVARKLAPDILLPRARRLAAEVGVTPSEWNIARGHRVLGTCRADGRISLSHLNMFLPPDLRDYIIFHELAHLSEMNHSPRFHAILNRYLGGREKELVARLNSFRWPVYR